MIIWLRKSSDPSEPLFSPQGNSNSSQMKWYRWKFAADFRETSGHQLLLGLPAHEAVRSFGEIFHVRMCLFILIWDRLPCIFSLLWSEWLDTKRHHAAPALPRQSSQHPRQPLCPLSGPVSTPDPSSAFTHSWAGTNSALRPLRRVSGLTVAGLKRDPQSQTQDARGCLMSSYC